MGQDTKMFIAAKESAIIDIMPNVIKSINKWQRDKLDNYWKSNGFDSRPQYLFRDKTIGANSNLKDYSNGIRSCFTYDFDSFTLSFCVEGESRNVFISHRCSCDYSEVYDGEKIIFSFGYWGMSKEIMMVIAESIKDFGDIYFIENDCSSEDWVKLY